MRRRYWKVVEHLDSMCHRISIINHSRVFHRVICDPLDRYYIGDILKYAEALGLRDPDE